MPLFHLAPTPFFTIPFLGGMRTEAALKAQENRRKIHQNHLELCHLCWQHHKTARLKCHRMCKIDIWGRGNCKQPSPQLIICIIFSTWQWNNTKAKPVSCPADRQMPRLSLLCLAGVCVFRLLKMRLNASRTVASCSRPRSRCFLHESNYVSNFPLDVINPFPPPWSEVALEWCTAVRWLMRKRRYPPPPVTLSWGRAADTSLKAKIGTYIGDALATW